MKSNGTAKITTSRSGRDEEISKRYDKAKIEYFLDLICSPEIDDACDLNRRNTRHESMVVATQLKVSGSVAGSEVFSFVQDQDDETINTALGEYSIVPKFSHEIEEEDNSIMNEVDERSSNGNTPSVLSTTCSSSDKLIQNGSTATTYVNVSSRDESSIHNVSKANSYVKVSSSEGGNSIQRLELTGRQRSMSDTTCSGNISYEKSRESSDDDIYSVETNSVSELNVYHQEYRPYQECHPYQLTRSRSISATISVASQQSYYTTDNSTLLDLKARKRRIERQVQAPPFSITVVNPSST